LIPLEYINAELEKDGFYGKISTTCTNFLGLSLKEKILLLEYQIMYLSVLKANYDEKLAK
jgi:hypothetical protein